MEGPPSGWFSWDCVQFNVIPVRANTTEVFVLACSRDTQITLYHLCSNLSFCRAPFRSSCLVANMGFTIVSPASDDESAVRHTHAAHAQGGGARRRAGAKAKAEPASSSGMGEATHP